jgi:hypothetical protein
MSPEVLLDHGRAGISEYASGVVMFAALLWAGFAAGLACAWSRRWYVVLAGGIVLSIASFAVAIGYLGGIVVFLLLAQPRQRTAA